MLRFGRQQVNISFERYYLRSAVDTRFVANAGVPPFPHRNGIVAKSPFGIDVWHNNRAMEGVPVFP
jgi:hypothetical protein